MLDTIEVMRQAAAILTEECDRVEHSVVNGGEVNEDGFITVRLRYPGSCHKCCIESICQHIDLNCACGSLECEHLWNIFIDRNKNLASHKK